MCNASLCESEPANLPLYYVGFTADEEKQDWAQQHVQAWMGDKFLDESLKLPNSCSLPAKTLPPELQEAAPPLPQLSVLTWCKNWLFEGLPSLKTPDSFLTKYWDHARFGAEFQTLIETARTDLPLDIPAETAGEKGKKRKVNVGGQENPPLSQAATGQKKARQESQDVELKPIPVTDLPSALTWEAVLTTQKHVHIVLGIGERIFLVNRSDLPQTLEAGTLIAGWFKGKFWQYRDSAGAASKKKKKTTETGDSNTPGDLDVLFQLEDADSHVTREGKLNKLLDVVAAQRQKQPDARVAYHTLKDSPQPGRPSWFALDLKFQVYFRTENVPSKAAEGNETTPKVALCSSGAFG